MTSKKRIIKSMQHNAFYVADPLNMTSDSPYQITYKFGGASEPSNFVGGSYAGYRAYTAAEQAVVREALDHLETLLNVEFTEHSGGGDPDMDFVIVDLTDPTVGHGGYQVGYSGVGSIDYSQFTSWDAFAAFDTGYDLVSGELATVLHEIAHAMGLKHPFDSQSSADTLPSDEENGRYTVMSYTPNPDSGDFGDQLRIYDVLALQNIWGKADNNTGDTTYDGTSGVIYDSAGSDTLDGSGASGATKINLKAGGFSSIDGLRNVSITYSSTIERAVGSNFGDVIKGNSADNLINANGGDDVVKGANGADWIDGGTGNDEIDGGKGTDLLTGGFGEDTILGGAGADSVQGGFDDDVLKGGGGNDALYGGGENDVLKGGGGKDRLMGEAGDDILEGGSGRDTFVFALGGGSDEIRDFRGKFDILEVTGLGDKATIKGLMSKSGDDVLIDFGGGDILLVEDISVKLLSKSLVV